VTPSDMRGVTTLFGSSSEARLALIRAVWPRVVGQQVAHRTEVASLTGDFLRLRVADTRWRKVLPRMRTVILTRLRQEIGGLAPHQIGLLEGPARLGADPASDLGQRPGTPRPVPPTMPSEALVAAARAIADPALRGDFLASATRYLASAAHRGSAKPSL
jgi:hypothetical protein